MLPEIFNEPVKANTKQKSGPLLYNLILVRIKQHFCYALQIQYYQNRGQKMTSIVRINCSRIFPFFCSKTKNCGTAKRYFTNGIHQVSSTKTFCKQVNLCITHTNKSKRDLHFYMAYI